MSESALSACQCLPFPCVRHRQGRTNTAKGSRYFREAGYVKIAKRGWPPRSTVGDGDPCRSMSAASSIRDLIETDGSASSEALLELHDQLEPVDIAFMLGEWEGGAL